MVMFDDPRGQDPREPREPRPPLPPTAEPELWEQAAPTTPAIEPPGDGGPDPAQGGTAVLPLDQIGDIPPPPIPRPPAISGPGVAGIPGTEAGTFALPGTRGAMPFRTPAYAAARPFRFGPGVPLAGGSTGVSGLGDGGLGMSPEEAAELLRALAAGRGGSGVV